MVSTSPAAADGSTGQVDLSAANEKGARSRGFLARLASIGAVVASVVVLIFIWDFGVRFADVPPYILPQPYDVLLALKSGLLVAPFDHLGYYVPAVNTLKNAMIGFVIATICGAILGAVMAEFRTVEKVLMPYLFAFQSVPKIAIAPLVVIWFGFGDGSKYALAALLGFFPVLVNVFAGCRAVEGEQLDLMRSLRASRLQTFFYLKLPSAAPFAFAGVNLAIVYALLGTIVAEFLGAQQGMGVVITKAQSVSDVAGLFAALVVLGVIGMALHFVVNKTEARLIHWTNRKR
jgi:NitT/TauT family transport system permease protein